MIRTAIAMALAAALCLIGGLESAGSAPRDESPPGQGRLFLSWHAPRGMPGASDSFVPVCDDTSARDTLYLSFEVPRSRPPVDSMHIIVRFRPAPGDTLGSFWFFRSGWANQQNMWIDFVPYAVFPCLTPWAPHGEPGDFDISYDHRSGEGVLEVAYRVPTTVTPPLDGGRRYCLARVRLLHRRPGLSGCGQAVCVKWTEATLHFATGRELAIPSGEDAIVGWGAGCPAAWSDSSTGHVRERPGRVGK